MTHFDTLTPTERTVLRLVHHSRKTDVIAGMLNLSPHTVNQHIASARRKLGGAGRYIAADALRAHEGHPSPHGSETMGIDPPLPSSAPVSAPGQSSDLPVGVREERMPFDPEEERSGAVDHLRAWLHEQTALPRICLILGASFLVVLLVVSAPLFAEQMGKIGRLLYTR